MGTAEWIALMLLIVIPGLRDARHAARDRHLVRGVRRICQVDRTNCPFKLQVTRRGRLVLHAGGWARAGKETHQILIAPRCADPTWCRCPR